MGIIEHIDNKVWQAVSPLIVNEKDGSILVWVPPGKFEMGDGKASNCPKHRVYLDGYYLGVHCITNRQYKRFVEATGHRSPDMADLGTPIWRGQSYPESSAEHPVVCVDWEDASAYCAWASLALPTEAQWERGARGTQGLIYPWGNDWDERHCRNDNNRDSRTTCPVFDYPTGTSGYGTYNQSGNVWEWCRDWYDENSYTSSPRENPAGPSSGLDRVLRGGSWGARVSGNFRGAYRGDGDPSLRLVYIGFRPCLPPG